MAILPLAFQGRIMKIVKTQINNNVNANVDFSKLSISLLRSFPHLNLGIKNFYIAGIDEFSEDTLISIKSLDVVVNLVSAIKMENIEILRISVDEPAVKALVLANGKTNWDIMNDSGQEEVADTTESQINTRVELKLFKITEGKIFYDDAATNMSANLDGFNFSMKGDLGSNFTTLMINSSVDKTGLIFEGIRYLKDAALGLNMDLDANLQDYIFTLRDNSFFINDLVLRFDGKAEITEEDDIIFDLKYGLDEADFKSLLSLIPAIYMTGYEDVVASGQLQLEGAVNGTYNERMMPDVNLNLIVSNGGFSYPDLPGSAENIGIDMKLFFDGVQNDNTTIDINRFHVELGSNPVDLTLNIKTPVSDMHVNGTLHADVNLANLADVVPLEETTLSGTVKADLDFMGFLSYVENEEYEKFKADGTVEIRDLLYNSEELPDINISEANLEFSPRYLNVNSFHAITGRSDFQVYGRMEDFIPYVFKDETIKGDFVFTSGVLDINELLIEESTETISDTADLPLTVIEIPGNIDFKLTARIDRIFYDKLQIDNTVGTVIVQDSKLVLDGLRMNMLEGTMQLRGEYNTSDINNPMVDFDFSISSMDITSAFGAFEMLQQFAPIAEKAVGKINLGLKYTSYLNQEMMPLLTSIAGSGNLKADIIGLKNSNTFTSIGNALNTTAFENMTLQNVGIDFDIRNGRLMVSPFEVRMGSSTLLIGGDQGLDQTMNYLLSISIPRSELGQAANNTVNNLVNRATAAGISIDPSENLNLGVQVGGTFRDPTISLDIRENSRQAVQAVKEQAVQAVQEQIDRQKDEAREAAQAEVDKIVAEAERQAEEIRQNARRAADIIIQEADSNGQKLVEQTKDPLSRRLAEEGAKKLREEADEAAQRVIDEADQKANNIINNARERAEKLLQ